MTGCGKRASDGMLHCRLSKGARPSTRIRVLLPKLSCKRESCAEIAVVRKDGTLVPIGGIPEGKTSYAFPVSKITGDPDVIDKAHGGPYRLLIDAFYQFDGEEWRVKGQGIVYLTVMDRGYKQLACDSPDVQWALKITRQCEAQYSTKFRSTLCGECE